METLTKSGLRRLVGLYRGDVEGAAEQLQDLVDNRREDLGLVLGDLPFEHDNDVVEQLAKHIERASRRRSTERVRVDRERARQLAHDVGAGSEWVGADSLALDPVKLDELVSCGSYNWLVFEPDMLRGVDRRRVHAVLRECRRVSFIEAELAPTEIVLRYRTADGRGRIRLWLQPAPIKSVPLVVEWPEHRVPMVQPQAAEAVADFVPSTEAPMAEPEPGIVSPGPPNQVEESLANASPTPPRPRQRVPSFLAHLLDAASEMGR